MASKAPPPTRLTEKNMKRSREMLALIDALPPSPEKDAILLHEQYGEWAYHVQDCRVKTYTHKPTQEEKVAGETVNEKGEKVKLFKKGIWCHHCKCSAQEFKRHRKTKKCIENRSKNEIHLQEIRNKKNKKRSPITKNKQKESNDRSAPNLNMWVEEQAEKKERQETPTPEVKEEKKKPKKLKITKKPTLSKEEKEKQTKKLIKQIAKYGAKKGDHYKILGLKKTATQKDIKTNYRNLAVILHPDRCKLEGSQEAIRKINKAYELLKDETKRTFYDKTGMEYDAFNYPRPANDENF
jgi:DnaJ-domain-containing protein 1